MSTPTATEAGTSRRRPRLRTVVTIALIGASLVSVLAVGLHNYLVARALLTDAVDAQLRNHQQGQVRAITNGLDRIGNTVSLIARMPSTVDALTDLDDAYTMLARRSNLLTAEQQRALDDFYDTAVATGEIGGPRLPPADELVPRAEVGRYLQYRYLVENPFPADRRAELDRAPDDTTAYGRVHAQVHPTLAELRTDVGVGDLLLLDNEGTVLYSTDKRIDFGTDTADSPVPHQGLTEVLRQRLSQVGVNEAVLIDFVPYAPASGRPVMFAAASVSDGAEVIGVVVVEVPVSRLNALLTSDGQWRRTGLGETGETYVVGPDQLLRSDARLWLEDPDAYLAALDDAGYPPELGTAIADAGSTVLQQPVRTEPVQEASGGQPFLGRADDYLGRPALTVAGPLRHADLDWIVVAELTVAEADAALASLNRVLLVAALILIPIVAAAGFFLADRIARPVKPVVATAAAVARGDLTARAPDLGRHEIGDVGRRLNRLTTDLLQQRDARQAEEREITRVLLSVLPARLVEQLRSEDVEITDLTDTGTVIALTVHGPLEQPEVSQDEALEASSRLSLLLEETAERLGVERVRSASDHHLFAAGLGEADVAADVAATFVTEVVAAFDDFERDTGITVGYHAGLSAGGVVAGLLHPETFTYGVFGEPTRSALALDAVAVDGQILLHASVASELGPGWLVEPASGLVDLRGEPVDAMVLTGRRVADREATATVES